jgi:hypothetical protein
MRMLSMLLKSKITNIRPKLNFFYFHNFLVTTSSTHTGLKCVKLADGYIMLGLLYNALIKIFYFLVKKLQ